MIDFEEEIKKFTPAMEASDAADIISKSDLTDMVDILRRVTEEKGRVNRSKDGIKK